MNIMKSVVSCFFILIPVCLYAGRPEMLSGLTSFSCYNQHPDTLKSFMIVKDDFFYTCSGEPCEGFAVDYYDEGQMNIRMSGKFERGFPVDTVKEYYQNRVLKSLYYPYKKNYKFSGHKYKYGLLMEFDEQGNCIRYRDDNKGMERIYRPDKSLESVLYYCRKRNELKYYVEYYPDGVKRTIVTNANKYDYDETGRLRRHWVRKSERYNKKYGTMSATFYFEEYNVSGEVSKKGRFYSNLYDHDRWYHIFPEFPAGIEMVPVQDFREVVYPVLNIKDVYRWDYVNRKTIVTRYEQQGDVWSESKSKSKSLPRIGND